MRFWPLFFAMFASTAAMGMPAEILLIRHAEKPKHGNELSERGWERARALPSLFETRPELLEYGLPAALYGMAPDHAGGSVRSIQTLKFVSERLGLPVHTEFTADDIVKLKDTVRADTNLNGKLIVICWNHDGIPALAEAFGMEGVGKWPGTVFDRAWKITFDAAGAAVMQDLPQSLLPGDSEM